MLIPNIYNQKPFHRPVVVWSHRCFCYICCHCFRHQHHHRPSKTASHLFVTMLSLWGLRWLISSFIFDFVPYPLSDSKHPDSASWSDGSNKQQTHVPRLGGKFLNRFKNRSTIQSDNNKPLCVTSAPPHTRTFHSHGPGWDRTARNGTKSQTSKIHKMISKRITPGKLSGLTHYRNPTRSDPTVAEMQTTLPFCHPQEL